MRYRIELLPSAVRELEAIPLRDRRRVARKIDGLQEDPRPPGAKALRGGGAGLRRLRAGHYRVIYRIRDEVLLVLVVKVGHRRDVYRGM